VFGGRTGAIPHLMTAFAILDVVLAIGVWRLLGRAPEPPQPRAGS
jgi:hypothetical protein